MDKSWISSKNRTSVKYMQGLVKFLDFAFEKASIDDRILCPCRKCVNALYKQKDEVVEHLLCNGFLKNYVIWRFHGECSNIRTNSRADVNESIFENDIPGMLEEVFVGVNMAEGSIHLNDDIDHPEDDSSFEGDQNEETTGVSKDKEKIFNLMKDAQIPLYDTCPESKLAAVLYLYHMKCLNGWTNNSFTQLLEYLSFLLPKGNNLPKSHYDAKNIISNLGLDYVKIHACPNGCALFWKDKINDDICGVCGESRWKQSKDCGEYEEDSPHLKKKKKPAKLLRWFPLKPRLQRLFLCSKTAADMRWHEGSIKDGLLRHPADSLAWKHFDLLNPQFAAEPRNVRLGLATDGFNPFKNMNVSYSTWPIILIPYNLPPWVCMKQTNFILSLLISGPKSPGDKIDIYMQPLVEELKELWDFGIETYDASIEKIFTLRAAIMWTLNDFPAYGTLSGWSVRGGKACPVCAYDTDSQWLNNSRKFCYMGHRRWLGQDHNFRKDDASFNGNFENRLTPSRMSGNALLEFSQVVPFDHSAGQPLKRLSILFELPYWKSNLLRHNIDVMHTEKNVFDNVFGTTISQFGKTKDNYKARQDLEEMGIRLELHPRCSNNGIGKVIPRACYQMTTREVEVFLSILKSIKFPDELSCNISRGVQVKQKKIIGLKTYDCHVLMQELLPVAVRGFLPDRVVVIIIGICHLFKCLCAKVLRPSDLDILQSRAVLLLCEMERVYPPSFFTIMVHLIIHLAEEAKLGGPVCYRWMYPIERFFFTMKGFVRNKAHPEGSIAEGFLANECLTFCSRYLYGGQTKFNRPPRNDKDIIPDVDEALPSPIGRPLGSKKKANHFHVRKRKRDSRKKLDSQSLFQAHRYILFNDIEIGPFRNEHQAILKRRHRSPRLSQYQLDKIHSLTFNEWFQERVADLEKERNVEISQKLKWLEKGPSDVAISYRGYIVNGYRFHTKETEKELSTQNSGVAVMATSSNYSSQHDNQPTEGEHNYYGVLKEILKLNYSGMYRVVLFKCDWVNPTKGCKVDKYGFTIVNLSSLSHTGANIEDDPYILASQASKVFYINDYLHEGWHVVKRVKVRDSFDIQDVNALGRNLDAGLAANESRTWLRSNIEDTEIHILAEQEDDPLNEDSDTYDDI